MQSKPFTLRKWKRGSEPDEAAYMAQKTPEERIAILQLICGVDNESAPRFEHVIRKFKRSELIKNKKASGRPKDAQDVEALMAVKKKTQK